MAKRAVKFKTPLAIGASHTTHVPFARNTGGFSLLRNVGYSGVDVEPSRWYKDCVTIVGINTEGKHNMSVNIPIEDVPAIIKALQDLV